MRGLVSWMRFDDKVWEAWSGRCSVRGVRKLEGLRLERGRVGW